MMTDIVEIDREDYYSDEEYQIDVRKDQIKKLQKEIAELQLEVPLICPNCDYHNIVKHSTLLIYEYYVHPYSCASGDYYNEEKYARVHCPNCHQYIQFCLKELDIPRTAFLNIVVHRIN